MEQINNILKIVICLLMAPLFIACKSKLDNPEILDPIYKDLVDSHGASVKIVEDTEKEILSLENEIKELEPNTKELRQSRKKLREANHKLVKAKQLSLYYEIRAQRRKVEDYRSYSIAFEKDLPWPDPEEYQSYLANKRLGAASKVWDARVPKLQNRIDEYKASRTPAEAPIEGGGH